MSDHYIYRLYDADGTLLYVGLTRNLEQRRKSHRSKPWWHEVVRWKISGPYSRAAAFAIETRAIEAEHPIHALSTSDAGRRGAEGGRRNRAAAHAEGRVCGLGPCRRCHPTLPGHRVSRTPAQPIVRTAD